MVRCGGSGICNEILTKLGNSYRTFLPRICHIVQLNMDTEHKSLLELRILQLIHDSYLYVSDSVILKSLIVSASL